MEIVFVAIRLLTIALEITILLEVIISMFPSMKETNIYNIIASFNYPVLLPFRVLQDKVFKNNLIDFSPLFAIMILSYIRMLF
ncbi:YggT family protein [Clostridium nigeriense]|uniref:YggT family protein n=1 Tax=Clostridium nigeriense TaxID=1805470 RepID=UPI003D328929